MNKVLQEIIDLLDVEPIEENLFVAKTTILSMFFGGQVLAQALASAFRTVDPEHSLHSLHSYFFARRRLDATHSLRSRPHS